jgi:4-amino-4-deoxy-L-arabinose transferase-like glycosyltransferase
VSSSAVSLPVARETTDVTAGGTWPWERISLVAIVALAAVLEFWHINQLGTPNAFYAAAVLSMTQNLHAFFFNSLDSIGFVTIDKPPLGFWIQALSARLLGFSGVSILLPEALATVGSVVLVYALVKRAFGGVPGLLAALVLALVPVSVMIGRNNTIDALLVSCLLLGVWTSLKATESGSLKWLLLTGVIVGLGFEIKMLEAYLVVPALGLVYLLCAPGAWPKRIGHLALAGLVMLAVSLAWPLAVDLTPASLRPWVDSTQDNSAISLALGYNGIDRLIGQRESVTQFLSGLGLKLPSSDTTATTGIAGGFGGMFNNGPVGPFRLFDQELGGQASWLLPLALLTIAIAMWKSITRRTAFFRTRQGQTAIVFGMWLLAAGGFFSVANFFHSYYLVTVGPPIAALAAIAIVGLWREFRAHTWLGWMLPVAVFGTALVQADMLGYYPAWSAWLIPLVIGTAALAAAGLLYGMLGERVHGTLGGSLVVARAASGLALVALLLAPALWSAYTVSSARGGGGVPAAGPQALGTRGFGFAAPPTGAPNASPRGRVGAASGPAGFSFAPGGNTSSAVIDYLLANQGSTPYLVATTDSNTAAPIILATGKPVMSLGGFSGGDPILSADQFASLVSSGEVRYVLVGRGGGGGFGGRGATSAIMSWVEANGTPVTIAGSQTQLYQVGA